MTRAWQEQQRLLRGLVGVYCVHLYGRAEPVRAPAPPGGPGMEAEVEELLQFLLRPGRGQKVAIAHIQEAGRRVVVVASPRWGPDLRPPGCWPLVDGRG